MSKNEESHLVSGRECGECTVCCVNLHIEDKSFIKPGDQACTHMVAKGGCKIYANRPSVCQDWHCAWRFMAQLGEEWRPDKSGVLLRSDEGGIIFQPIGVPKKVLTTERAIELIGGGVAQGVPLSMSIPTKKGFRSFAIKLNEHLEEAVSTRHFPSIKAKLIELIDFCAAQNTDAIEPQAQSQVFHRAH